jgi:ribosome-associated translation inhibitor RaiA
MTKRDAAEIDDPVVTVSGDVTDEVSEHARRTIGGLARYTRRPMQQARVRLTTLANPAVERPVLAQGNLAVNGRIVRAQVTAHSPREAVDLLQDRLRQGLLRLDRHWEARRGSMPVGGEHQWRRGQEPTHRPPYYPRPPEERQVVRHKTYGPSIATPDEAVQDMELLDYDFYLFTDSESGQDTVIYRSGPSGYRLAGLTPPAPYWPAPAVPLTTSDHPAPRLDVDGAIERLNLTGLPFLFYADATTGRGHVLYRRYDGHYGLITPAG